MSTVYGTGHEVPWPLFVGDGTAAVRVARDRAAKSGMWRDRLVRDVASVLASDTTGELIQRLTVVAQTAQAFAHDVEAAGNF